MTPPGNEHFSNWKLHRLLIILLGKACLSFSCTLVSWVYCRLSLHVMFYYILFHHMLVSSTISYPYLIMSHHCIYQHGNKFKSYSKTVSHINAHVVGVPSKKPVFFNPVLGDYPWNVVVFPQCSYMFYASLSSLVGGLVAINFIFPYIGNNHPNWLIFFRGVETTNQIHLWDFEWKYTASIFLDDPTTLW